LNFVKMPRAPSCPSFLRWRDGTRREGNERGRALHFEIFPPRGSSIRVGGTTECARFHGAVHGSCWLSAARLVICAPQTLHASSSTMTITSFRYHAERLRVAYTRWVVIRVRSFQPLEAMSHDASHCSECSIHRHMCLKPWLLCRSIACTRWCARSQQTTPHGLIS